jgi:hypothetical protein
MKNLFARLWQDDAGFVVSTELVLVSTILVIGVLIGQSTLRDAVISELADSAESINNINQSYSYSSVTAHSSSVAGSLFTDAEDFCESGTDGAQTSAGSGMCVNFAVGVTDNG